MLTTNFILVLVVLTNLKLLGSSRLGASIRVVAAQGVVLGFLPILAHWHELSLHFALLAAGTIAIKGIVFPWFLFRAVREAEVIREIEPYVGYVASLVLGVLALGVSFWMCTRLPMPENHRLTVAGAGGALFHFRRAVSHRQPQTRGEPGAGFSRAGERDLHVRCGRGGAHAVAGRSRACCWTCLWRCSSWASPSSTSTASSITLTLTG